MSISKLIINQLGVEGHATCTNTDDVVDLKRSTRVGMRSELSGMCAKRSSAVGTVYYRLIVRNSHVHFSTLVCHDAVYDPALYPTTGSLCIMQNAVTKHLSQSIRCFRGVSAIVKATEKNTAIITR
jgi:hypothetical protein